MAKIAWSHAAATAFVALIRAEREATGPESANALRQRITVRVRLLRGFPELGKLLPELPDGGIRELSIGSRRVLYRTTDEAVLILNVVQSQDHRLPLVAAITNDRDRT